MGSKAMSGEAAYVFNTEDKLLGKGSYANVYRVQRKDNKWSFAAKIFKMSVNFRSEDEEKRVMKEKHNYYKT